MSKKRTAAGTNPAEEATTAAKDAKETTEKAEPKKCKKMYVGPTIPGFATNNVVYDGIPDYTQEYLVKTPELNNLFVEVVDYSKANRMLREKRGYIYSAYLKALEIKNTKRR